MTDLLTRAVLAARTTPAEPHAATQGALLWVKLLKSASFRALTRAGHLALAKIVIELSNGRTSVTHRMFEAYGLDRCGIGHAVCELEALGIVVVHRSTAKANEFAMSSRWMAIGSLAEAKQRRDEARHYGIIRKRKVERQSARIDREQRLAWLQSALNAPDRVSILAEFDDVALKTLQAVVVAIQKRTPANYVTLCERVGCGRNKIASALSTLRETGLIETQNGRRRCTYRIGGWNVIGVVRAHERADA